MVLQRASLMPLHRQIYEQWRTGILTGRFRRGERVPSTRELATTLAVSRSTVTESYEQLIAEGYLDATQGSGTFVCHELPDEALRPSRAGITIKDEEPTIRLSRYGAGLREDFVYPETPPGFIRFTHWRPDLERFPFALWRKLVARHLRGASHELYDYADLFDYAEQSAGYEPLRREIAAYVARSRAVRCTVEQVVIVNGSQQGLDLCVRLLLDRGDEVAFENPGYQGARQIFQAHGARLRPARIDPDGVVIGDLGRKTRLVYVTPSHQFPTGVSMSLARRLELIEWARGHRGSTSKGSAIIEDDYDSEYRYTTSPIASLQGLDGHDRVIYIGTFSKVLFPSLRLGYVVIPPDLIDRFLAVRRTMDLGPPRFFQDVLADFINEGHFARHIRRMRVLYGGRRTALVNSISQELGPRVEVLGAQAGMHLTVTLPKGTRDKEIAERAAAMNFWLWPLSPLYMSPRSRPGFILGFGSTAARHIPRAVRKFRSLLDAR
jgi:GntR family transcriptional regulator/MocR family aminotransferase